MTTVSSITIKGRDYTVEVINDNELGDGRCGYRLTGAKGANYTTFRNVNHPDRMYLVAHGGRLGFRVDPLGPLWLSDKSGVLAVR